MHDLVKERYFICKKLGRYIKVVRTSIVTALVMQLISIPLVMVPPILFSILVGKVMIDKDIGMLKWILVGYTALYGVRFVVDAVGLQASNRVQNRFAADIRKTVWSNIINMPYLEYVMKDTGDIKMRLDEDVSNISRFIKSQIIEYVFNLLVAIVHIVVVLVISPAMTAICITGIPLTFLAGIFIAKGTGAVNEETRIVNGDNYSWQFNTLQKWKEVKAFSAERLQYKKSVRFRHKLAKLGVRWIFFWFLNEALDFFKDNILTKVLLYLVGALFILSGKITIGVLILFIQYFAALFKSLDALNRKDIELKANKPYYDRIFQYIDERTSDIKRKKHVLTGEITLNDVSFKYNNDQADILKGVSFHIAAGDYVAITGKSGCGKTTLVKLMTNLYKAGCGTIEYNGLQVDMIDEMDLYSSIGVVMQDNYLFNMSIRENLILAKPKASEGELYEACRKADILDFIESLPEKLDTVIGERGIKLSGGQKQRLVIAQVLLRKPRIMIMDEATSSLDHLSEQKIHEAIREVSKDCTVIVIAHRQSSIMAANKVICVEEGEMAYDVV